MLAPCSVKENVLDIGEGRNAQSEMVASRFADRLGGKVQARSAGLREPDRTGSFGSEPGIGESNRGPTPRHGHGEPASG
jgi:hypothetical protein